MQPLRSAIEARPVSSILIVDDHPLYSDALESALEMMFSGCDIRKAQTLNAALETAAAGFDPARDAA